MLHDFMTLRMLAICSLALPALAGQDCNENGIPDDLDIAQEHSGDCDVDGVPDECQFGEVLLYETFDGSPVLPPGVTYSFETLWHTTTACRPSGGGASGAYAYYGNNAQCTFQLGANPGRFQVHDVPLPAESVVTLQYWSYYEGEFGGRAGCDPDFPTDYVSVSVNGVHVDDYCDEPLTPQWTWRTLDLTPFAGQQVTISFYFLAGDGLFNDYFGWGVDHLRITTFSDVSGNGVPDACESIGQTYCDTNPNSTGITADLAALGSLDVDDGDLWLRTTNVPQNQIGYYLMSRNQGQLMLPPPSQGILCLGSPRVRLNTMGNVQNSGSLGEIRVRLDFPNLPQGTVFHAGETWNFQCWFRDGMSSNTSRGVFVAFD